MKIHHVTDEWDYTLSVEETTKYIYLTLSILRQPDRVPDCTVDGVRVRSWANVSLGRSGTWGGVNEVWLRGFKTILNGEDESRLQFRTRRDATEQLIRVYNALRRYEKVRGSL